jgi:hypothetical protein
MALLDRQPGRELGIDLAALEGQIGLGTAIVTEDDLSTPPGRIPTPTARRRVVISWWST